MSGHEEVAASETGCDKCTMRSTHPDTSTHWTIIKLYASERVDGWNLFIMVFWSITYRQTIAITVP
jgi:hypothetical protein